MYLCEKYIFSYQKRYVRIIVFFYEKTFLLRCMLFIKCKMLNIIYQILWQLLFFVHTLYEYWVWLRLRVIAFALWSYDRCQTQAALEQKEYEFLKQCKTQINKTPKHLNIIIGPDDNAQHAVNERLLSKLLQYALHMDINCISFYDTRFHNDSEQKLKLEKLQCPKGVKCKSMERHYAVWQLEAEEKQKSLANGGGKEINGSCDNGMANGHSHSGVSNIKNSSLEIYEIQPSDNHSMLAKVCRELFQQRQSADVQKLLTDRTLLTKRITEELKHHLNHLSEPELSIVFFADLCTFGMLPWHIRFTEFHRHEPAKRFDVETFAHILYKYSRCEQRWGT